MQNQSTFKPGNSVVKNPTGWISSVSDGWGAGEGVGIVAELLTEFDDGNTVNVKWPTGRAFQRPEELLLVTDLHSAPTLRCAPAVHGVARRFTTSAASTRILLIDDDLDAVWLLSKLLVRHGCDAHFTDDPHEALEIARDFQPRAVCVDIGMPVMDGYTLARSLRQLAGMRDCRIIAVTGHPPDRVRMEKAGINMHLLKPVGASVLAQAVGDLAS